MPSVSAQVGTGPSVHQQPCEHLRPWLQDRLPCVSAIDFCVRVACNGRRAASILQQTCHISALLFRADSFWKRNC